jgi:hypothetical protein
MRKMLVDLLASKSFPIENITNKIMNKEQDKPSDIVDDKLPIAWGVVADAEIEGYKIFDERITTISKKNHQRVEALQGLLTVLTKDHTDDNTDNRME